MCVCVCLIKWSEERSWQLSLEGECYIMKILSFKILHTFGIYGWHQEKKTFPEPTCWKLVEAWGAKCTKPIQKKK